MSYTKKVFSIASQAVAKFNAGSAMQRVGTGEFDARHYAAVLEQIYHYVKHNTGMQTLAGSRFKGEQRNQLKKFLLHAVSEVGHEELALNDLACLGQDVESVKRRNPLPSTSLS